eukprot:TRINITY_DN8376_c0_g1_i1.p1 TRINITY_DN8376_c0_g1~~TRINITY_DN8376_c0_g1_i1.p1  ORF type:complete len:367 (-),score=65.78 TRINITY_DN8376_c0_g1_i1:190-1290(-)
MISRQGRDEVPVGPSLGAGPASKQGRALVQGSSGVGSEAKQLLYGDQEPQQTRGWRPPVMPGPVDVTSGPPAPALQSKLGVARERRPPNEAELQLRRQNAEEASKVYQEARASCRDVRERASQAKVPYAVGSTEGSTAELNQPYEQRTRSRPASRELEEVEADAEKTMLLRDIQDAAAEASLREMEEAEAAAAALREMDAAAGLRETESAAIPNAGRGPVPGRKSEAADAYYASRTVAEQGRARNRGDGLVFPDAKSGPSPEPPRKLQLQPDAGSEAADAYFASRAVADQGRTRNRGASAVFPGPAPASQHSGKSSPQQRQPQSDFGYGAAGRPAQRDQDFSIFGTPSALPAPPARVGGQNIITWG